MRLGGQGQAWPRGAMEGVGVFSFCLFFLPSPIGCRVGYVTSIALIACFFCVHGARLWCVLHVLGPHWPYTHWHAGQSSLTCPGRLASDLCFKALLISPTNQWSVWTKHLPMCLVVTEIWKLQFKIKVYRTSVSVR